MINYIIIAFMTLICGFLGAWGGASGTSLNWRRTGIPLLLTLLAVIYLKSWWIITIMSMIGALSIGYGIPDYPDEGSSLGRFWYKIVHYNLFWTNVLTRGTIGLVILVSLLSIPVLKSSYLIYAIAGAIIVVGTSLISWRDLGSYTLFNKKLTWAETITYALIGLCAGSIIVL